MKNYFLSMLIGMTIGTLLHFYFGLALKNKNQRPYIKSFDVPSSNYITSINKNLEEKNIRPEKIKGMLYFPESHIIEIFYIED